MAQQIIKLPWQHDQAIATIVLDKDDLDDVVSVLKGIKGGANKAIRLSINKGLTGVRTDMVRETRNVLNVKAKTVRQSIFLKKASAGSMSAYARSTGKPLNLFHFGAKQNKKGVSVKVLKDLARQTIEHAFIAKLSQSGPGVYWRKKTQYVGTKKKTKTDRAYAAMPWKYRFPIEALTGPRIQDVMGRPDVIQKIEEGARVRVRKELDHQVQKILDKHRGS
jgi:hypothetical protein